MLSSRHFDVPYSTDSDLNKKSEHAISPGAAKMFKFVGILFPRKLHTHKRSKCHFALFTFFAILLLWKFECVSWLWRYSLEPNETFEAASEKSSDEKNFETLYSVVETVNRAVAWQPVVLRILPSASNGLKAGRSTFWGRAMNELEIIALRIEHVGNDVYKAEFKPSFGGLYEVVIYLTYVNDEQFNCARHVPSRMVNITGSPFFLPVHGRPPPENITRYCPQRESGTAQGRWVKCGALRGIERCSGWQLIPKFDFDGRHGYFWLPYTCQLHYYSDDEMRKCLAKNGWERIVFTGDSHTRFRTYHWATRLYGACEKCGKNHVKTSFDHVPKMEWVFDARGTRWPASFPKSVRRPNEIYVHPKSRRSRFSYAFPNSTFHGDIFFMNFGHWLLREMTFEEFMAKKLVSFLQAVKIMNNTGGISDSKKENTKEAKLMDRKVKPKRFLWVNNLSLKWREDKDVFDWTMTPSPSTIGYLNSFLDQAMKEAGIRVVDAFQVSNPRLDAIHDGTHYAKLFPNGICAGAVENAVTNVILNVLCN